MESENLNAENIETAKSYYRLLEEVVGELSPEERARIYRPCAIDCVKGVVLHELRRQFEECGCDLDAQFTKYGDTEYLFAKVLEPGHLYEMGYPRCFCPMVNEGFVRTPHHCECSRQSILYVLHELLPQKKIDVETIETVLTGAPKCRFRVRID